MFLFIFLTHNTPIGLIPLQEKMVIDTTRQLFLVVRNEYHRLVLALAKSLNDVLHQPTIHIVESMQRFIQNQQFWVFHERASQQHQSLFATR